MKILASIFILFLVSIAITGLNRFKVRPGYFWFLAFGVTFTAWTLILISYTTEPVLITLLNWEDNSFFHASPSLLLDEYSWLYAVAVTTLLLAVLLTDASRVWDIQPAAWGVDLAITAAGLLALFAANPLTLLLAWATVDLTETYTLLTQLTSNEQREQVVVSFSVRVVGILLLIFAILQTQIMGGLLVFWEIPKAISGYLILAAGFRLGVLLPHQPFIQEPPLRRGLGTIVRLVPVATSLVLLTRVAVVGASAEWELGLTVASAASLMLGGLGWFFSRNELDGRPFWIFGMSTLAVVGSARAMPFVSQAWGLGLLISGGILFLYSTKRRRYLWIPASGLLAISGLPFTPTWRGFSLFAGMNPIFSIVFSLGVGFLFLGYLRHSLSVIESGDEIESWARILYPIGLITPPLVFWGLAYSQKWLHPVQMGLQGVEWWLGALIISLVSGITYLLLRKSTRFSLENLIGKRAFSLGGIYRLLWRGYVSISKLGQYLADLLEGEGGIFWTVLILVLLVTFIVQQIGGG